MKKTFTLKLKQAFKTIQVHTSFSCDILQNCVNLLHCHQGWG